MATGAVIVALAAGCTHWLHVHGFLEHWETGNLDRLLVGRRTVPFNDLTLVVVTEADYKKPFLSASPLNSTLILQLLEEIGNRSPYAIIVDLDTAEWSGETLTRARKLSQTMPVFWTCIAWPRTDEHGQPLPGWELGKALGGDCDKAPGGLPAYLVDDDGVVRRYLPQFDLGEHHQVPSVARLTAEAWQQKHLAARALPDEVSEEGPARLINFLRRQYSFDRLSAGSIFDHPAPPDAPADPKITGKIVVLGATFRAARDRFRTAVGPMDGVELVAHTIATEINGSLSMMTHKQFTGLDVLLGLLLVAGAYFLPRAWALPITFCLVPVLAVLASWILYQSTGYFMSFVPILTGVALHELLEHLYEDLELRRELRRLRATVPPPH